MERLIHASTRFEQVLNGRSGYKNRPTTPSIKQRRAATGWCTAFGRQGVFMVVFPKGFPKRFASVLSQKSGAAALLIALGAAASASHAQSMRLLTNGNFQTGTFAGWTVATVRGPADTGGSRNFYIDTPGTDTPAEAGVTFTTAQNTLPGGCGSFYAVSASDYFGQSALLQSFTTPTITSGQGLRLTLTFDLFVNDQTGWSNMAQDPSGLDYTSGGTGNANQYARFGLPRRTTLPPSIWAWTTWVSKPTSRPNHPRLF